MITKVEGIIINERFYGETSKILNILTKEYGLIGVISKGCRTLKSELRSVSSKLTYGDFNIFYKKDKLSNLISVDVKDTFNIIKTDIEKISYASFLLELSEQVVKQTETNILEILIESLKKINEGFDPLVITNILELKYLDYLGVMPIIDCCSVCGNKANIVTLSSDKGGYLCKNCRTTEPIMDIKTIKLIRMFYYVDIKKIEKINIKEKCKKEINLFLELYYDKYTGLYLKSKKFLQTLNKI